MTPHAGQLLTYRLPVPQLLRDVRVSARAVLREEDQPDTVILAAKLANVGYRVAVRTALGGGAGMWAGCWRCAGVCDALQASKASGGGARVCACVCVCGHGRGRVRVRVGVRVGVVGGLGGGGG